MYLLREFGRVNEHNLMALVYMSHWSVEAEWGNPQPSCYSPHAVNKGPFGGLFNVVSFAFLCFLEISLFKMTPKRNAKMLPSVLQAQGGCDVPYRENTWGRGLHAGMNYNTFHGKFKGNKSMIYILNKISWNINTHKTSLNIDHLMKMLCQRHTGSSYISPRNSDSIFINSVFMVTLHKNIGNTKNLQHFAKKTNKPTTNLWEKKNRPTE